MNQHVGQIVFKLCVLLGPHLIELLSVTLRLKGSHLLLRHDALGIIYVVVVVGAGGCNSVGHHLRAVFFGRLEMA